MPHLAWKHKYRYDNRNWDYATTQNAIGSAATTLPAFDGNWSGFYYLVSRHALAGDGTFQHKVGAATMQYGTASVYFGLASSPDEMYSGGNNIPYRITNYGSISTGAGISLAPTDVLEWTRTGTTLTLKKNGSNAATWNNVTGDLYFHVGIYFDGKFNNPHSIFDATITGTLKAEAAPSQAPVISVTPGYKRNHVRINSYPTGANGVSIYRSTSNSFTENDLIASEWAYPYFEDTTAINGTGYYYQAKATKNGLSHSVASNVVGAITPSAANKPALRQNTAFLLGLPTGTVKSYGDEGDDTEKWLNKLSELHSLKWGLIVPKRNVRISYTIFGNTNAAGTVSVTNGGTMVTGDANCRFTEEYAPDRIIRLEYSSGNYSIHFIKYVHSNTSLELWDRVNADGNLPWYTQSGLSHRGWYETANNDDDRLRSHVACYDTMMSLYLAYYQSGSPYHLQIAQEFAEMWEAHVRSMKPTNGEYQIVPRLINLEGLLLRGEEVSNTTGVTNKYLDTVRDFLDSNAYWLTNQINGNNGNGTYEETRERAFYLKFMAGYAKVHPVQSTRDLFKARALDWFKLYYGRQAAKYSDKVPRFDYLDFNNVRYYHYWQPFIYTFYFEAAISIYQLTNDAQVKDLLLSAMEVHWTRGYDNRLTVARNNTTRARQFLYAIYHHVDPDQTQWTYTTPENPYIDKESYGDTPNIKNEVGSEPIPVPGYGAGFGNGRFLNNPCIYAYGAAYWISGDSKWITRGNELLDSAYSTLDGESSRYESTYNGKNVNESSRRGPAYYAFRDVIPVEGNTPPPPALTVEVAPTGNALALSGLGQQMFRAAVLGANNPPQTVNWETTIGSITAAGLLTAPAALQAPTQSTGTTANVVFRAADGFSITGNSTERIAGGSAAGSVETTETIGQTGEKFSFKLQPNTTSTSLEVQFWNGTGFFALFNNGAIKDFNGTVVKAAPSSLDRNQIFEVIKTADSLEFKLGGAVYYTGAAGTMTGTTPVRMFVEASNAASDLGAGVTNATVTTVSSSSSSNSSGPVTTSIQWQNGNGGFTETGNAAIRANGGAYYGHVETVQTIQNDNDCFSFKLEPVNGLSFRIHWTDGTTVYNMKPNGDIWSAADPGNDGHPAIDYSQTWTVKRVNGTRLEFRQGNVLFHQTPVGAIAANAPLRMYLKANNEDYDWGSGVNSVTVTTGSGSGSGSSNDNTPAESVTPLVWAGNTGGFDVTGSRAVRNSNLPDFAQVRSTQKLTRNGDRFQFAFEPSAGAIQIIVWDGSVGFALSSLGKIVHNGVEVFDYSASFNLGATHTVKRVNNSQVEFAQNGTAYYTTPLNVLGATAAFELDINSYSRATDAGAGLSTASIASPSGEQTAVITARSTADNTVFAQISMRILAQGDTTQVVNSVEINNAPSSVSGGASANLAAIVYGANVPQTVNWTASAGSITAQGVFTAPAATGSAQTITITARSTADNTKSGTTTVTVPASVPGSPTVTNVTVSPANVSVNGGQTQPFAAIVSGANNPAQTVNWQASAGSINSSGVFTAPAATGTPQTITITATSTVDNTKSGTATVTVSATAPTVTGVTVSPSSVIVSGNGTQTFAAIVAGTNNPSQAVTWQIQSGNGSINQSGVFTAPPALSTPQTIIVRAVSQANNSFSGDAVVSIPAQLPQVPGNGRNARVVTRSVTVTTEPTIVSASAFWRLRMLASNAGVTIFIGDADVNPQNGIPLPASGALFQDRTNEAIYACVATGTADLRIREIAV